MSQRLKNDPHGFTIYSVNQFLQILALTHTYEQSQLFHLAYSCHFELRMNQNSFQLEFHSMT